MNSSQYLLSFYGISECCIIFHFHYIFPFRSISTCEATFSCKTNAYINLCLFIRKYNKSSVSFSSYCSIFYLTIRKTLLSCFSLWLNFGWQLNTAYAFGSSCKKCNYESYFVSIWVGIVLLVFVLVKASDIHLTLYIGHETCTKTKVGRISQRRQ